MAIAVNCGYLPSKPSHIPAKMCTPSQKRLTKQAPPPLFISTNPTHVNPLHLRDLYTLCNYSCHRFPTTPPHVDTDKLRIALSHSSLTVAVFSSPQYSDGDWFSRLMPVTPFNGRLVGFGRAVSDFGLTASIYDVTVLPTLQGRGIGRMIVQKIIRVLTSRGIYDIAALCSNEERLFFEACGFGDDMLGSTTMMYTRTGSVSPLGNQMVKCAGRKLLLVPPSREPFQS